MHDFEKDRKRVQDIIDKSRWNPAKMRRLAETMCKLTTNHDKILERAKIANDILGDGNIITEVFLSKARSLEIHPAIIDRWVFNK